MNRSRYRLGVDWGGAKEPCIRWGPGFPRGKGHFRGAPLRCGLSLKFFDRLLSIDSRMKTTED